MPFPAHDDLCSHHGHDTAWPFRIMSTSPREYNYVGPPEVAERVAGGPGGALLTRPRDVLEWLSDMDAAECVATFVIDTSGRLRVDVRSSEHVACAAGGRVLSAGEMTLARDGDSVSVVAVNNLSTGYCPEPSSWAQVAAALDGLSIAHPSAFTSAFEFRRCEHCGERNLVKEEWFVCALCDGQLPRAWNFEHPAVASVSVEPAATPQSASPVRRAPHYSLHKEQLIDAVSGLLEIARDYSAGELIRIFHSYLRADILEVPSQAPDRLRRALVECRYLERTPDGRHYWVADTRDLTMPESMVAWRARVLDVVVAARKHGLGRARCPLCETEGSPYELLAHADREHAPAVAVPSSQPRLLTRLWDYLLYWP